jgi:hypothetical protein
MEGLMSQKHLNTFILGITILAGAIVGIEIGLALCKL